MQPGIAIPILPSRSLDETRAFYERLGFKTVGWWPDTLGGYAIVKKGDLGMHFFLNKELSPLENYAGCYWRVNAVDALYAECAGTPRLTAVEDKPWGMREFAFIDPNGNLIRVGEEIVRH